MIQNIKTSDTAFLASSIASSVAVLLQWLPTVFAALTSIATFCWAWIRLYETKTVQDFLARRKKK